jgi:hypothetical protein
LLGPLIFAGRHEETTTPFGQQHGGSRRLELPAGNYLFAQERREGNGLRATLDRNEFVEMAIEVQKDGLWERLAPADRLYLRYLFEDGRAVSQVFRPY